MTDDLITNDESVMKEGPIVFNGVNGATGQPITKTYEELAGFIKSEGQAPSPEKVEEAKLLAQVVKAASEELYGLPLDVSDESNLKQTGWGIVFAVSEDPAVIAALQPLIKHRREEIGAAPKAILLEAEYRAGESYRDWLKRHGVAPVNVKPNKVPFYLLLVGSPEQIPFSFGYQLDLDYAVGRLHFDTAAEYEQYAQSVVAYETGNSVPNAKEAVFFGTKHPLDKATNLSANLLMKPLTDGVPNDGEPPIADDFGFRQKKLIGQNAKKAALAEVLSPPAGTASPAFLFTATHGLEWDMADARQRQQQGALVCQDWQYLKPPSPNHYFAASDLAAEARVHGLISFNFACFGAGTPKFDRFANQPGTPTLPIANQAFLAALPQALLSHPNGGALACIGHVERAWGCSILTEGVDTIQPFKNAIGRILLGQRVGLALKDFNEKYANVSTELVSLLEEIKRFGKQVPDKLLAMRWTERNDAESYVVLGDPAVRLRVDKLQ